MYLAEELMVFAGMLNVGVFISSSLKNISRKAALMGYKSMYVGYKLIFSIAKGAIFAAKVAGTLLYHTILVPGYKAYLAGKALIRPLVGPIKNKFIFIFTNRYIIHLTMISMAVGVFVMTQQVRESRAEGYGESSIIYSIISNTDLSDEQVITETLDISELRMIVGTDTDTVAVGSEPQLAPNEVLAPTDDLALTQGGSAVVRPEFSSIEASKTTRDTIVAYKVAEGESIGTIAQKFNLKQETVLWANNLSRTSLIRPGQDLIIPPTDGIIYTIKSGDTLKKLAQKFEAQEDSIISYNKLADASDLEVGGTLIIPGGKPYYAPASRPSVGTSVARGDAIRPSTGGTGYTGESTSELLWPTNTHRISQYYSWRHTGLDIDGDFGDPLWAAESGTVIRVQYLNYGYGYNVLIDHGNGIQTIYAHMQKIVVKEGQAVDRGAYLGEEGSTGRSTGSHLHFEVRVNGKRMNPLNYIR